MHRGFLKAVALAFLATLIVRSANRGLPAPVRLLAVTRLIVVIYLGIVANNALLVSSRSVTGFLRSPAPHRIDRLLGI